MTAKILSLRTITGRGNLRALADVEIVFQGSATLKIHGCRVIQQSYQRAYMALPQVETASGGFFAAVSSPELRAVIEPLVLAAWCQQQEVKA